MTKTAVALAGVVTLGRCHVVLSGFDGGKVRDNYNLFFVRSEFSMQECQQGFETDDGNFYTTGDRL